MRNGTFLAVFCTLILVGVSVYAGEMQNGDLEPGAMGSIHKRRGYG